MQFLVSTSSEDVIVKDLGVFIQHPTVDRDLANEFSAEEIANSSDLTELISDNLLMLKIGSQDYAQVEVDGYDYTPYMLLQQNFSAFAMQEEFVTSSELRSSNKDIEIFTDVFPVQVSSTTSFTRVIICNGAQFETWRAFPGDIAVIVGGAAAGSYTVSSVDDQKTIIVVEAIPSSIGAGVLTIYHPTGASTIGFDPTGLTNIVSSDVQGALQDLDSAISSGGLVESTHKVLDSLIHNLSENSYEEIIYSGGKVTSIVIFTDITKSIKIREFIYTYSGNRVSQEEIIQYNGLGVEIQRLSSEFAYSGNSIVSATHTETT